MGRRVRLRRTGLRQLVEQNGSEACVTATPKGSVGSTQSSCGSKGGDGGLGYADT